MLFWRRTLGICRASWESCGNWAEAHGSGVPGGSKATLDRGCYGTLVHFWWRQWNPWGSLNFGRSMCNAVHCFGRSTLWHWFQYHSEKSLFSVPCKKETVPIDPLFLYSACDVQQTPRLKSSPPSTITGRTKTFQWMSNSQTMIESGKYFSVAVTWVLWKDWKIPWCPVQELLTLWDFWAHWWMEDVFPLYFC